MIAPLRSRRNPPPAAGIGAPSSLPMPMAKTRTPSAAMRFATSIAPPGVVLAVGDEQHRLGAGGATAERGQRRLERLGQVGALHRDRFGVERVEEELGRAVVERHRALHEGDPGERDDGDAIARQHLQQVVDLALGALEAWQRAPDVFHQHAVRDVEGDHDVDAAPLDLLPGVADLESRQSDQQRGHGDRHQSRLEHAAARARSTGQPLDHRRHGKPAQPGGAGAEAEQMEDDQRRQQPQRPQRPRLADARVAPDQRSRPAPSPPALPRALRGRRTGACGPLTATPAAGCRAASPRPAAARARRARSHG